MGDENDETRHVIPIENPTTESQKSKVCYTPNWVLGKSKLVNFHFMFLLSYFI